MASRKKIFAGSELTLQSHRIPTPAHRLMSIASSALGISISIRLVSLAHTQRIQPTTSFALPRFFSTSPTPFTKKRMPPKKTQVVEKAKLGRPSNNLKMGIVGVPNVGKSSLFNTIAKCDLGKSANFP